jgi:hypothetical protein
MNVYKEREKKRESELPRVVLTFDRVREEVDKRIPDAVVMEIVKSGDRKKIKEINDAAKAINKYANGWSRYAFYVLMNKKVAELFVKYPDKFVEISSYAKKFSVDAFYVLMDERVAKKFIEYAEKRATIETFIAAAFSLNNNAPIELGRPLDELHAQTRKRMEYLNKLTTPQIVGLLCSNPEFFYTSSNHLMFDRLKKDIGANWLEYLVSKYELDDEQLRNLVFRCINYDRLFGRPNSLMGEKDLPRIKEIILKGIYSGEFDVKYFYMLANGIGTIGKYIPELADILDERLKELEISPKSTETEKLKHALEFLKYLVGGMIGDEEKRKIAEKSYFEPENYKVGGKLQVLQIFDIGGTKNDHWLMSQKWFEGKYGRPKVGKDGELIYENASSRVVLSIGDDETKNKEFAQKWMRENKKGIITFRGHSYSLVKNMPLTYSETLKAASCSYLGAAEAQEALQNILPQIQTRI